ncbi:MAG: hypothetical protein APF81_17685 [Desulfosporosinus sp. BRH_c37]|nr:MAG: hypothetical protein APF81_17685 [Desulfosporosinus sp. BRH_c37]
MQKSLNANMDFLLYEKGEDFLLNGVTQRGLFVEATEKISFYDDIILTSAVPFKTGGLVYYQNSNWLMISEIQNNEDIDTSIYRARIRKCNNTLTLNISGILHTIPCIVMDKISLNIDSSTYISTLDTQIYILVANDAINSNIKLNNIFKIGNLNYQVRNIDDISKSGLLYIKMDFTVEAQVFPNYSITITSGESVTTDIVSPVQLNIEQKDGETVLTEPLPVIFTSSDEAIATVNSIGLVTPVSVGSVTMNVALESDTAVNDSIVITVEEIPVIETYTLELTGSIQPDTEVKSGQTKTYTCVKKNSSGVVVEGALFDFTVIPGTTSPAAYTFTILNDTQCTVKCNQYLYYIDLVATDRSDNTLTVSKHIKLRGIL